MQLAWMILPLLILIVAVFEYRIRKPGQIVLFESKGKVRLRKSKFFPRHFSLPISISTHSFSSSFESEAKGKISLNVKISTSITPSVENIAQLIRIGGWEKNMLSAAAKELDVIIQGLVRNFSELHEVDLLTTAKLHSYLSEHTNDINIKLGVDLLSLTIQSLEPVEKKISDAVKQKEEARILEETEKTNQHARISSAQIKMKADEEIMNYEHALEIKRFQLKEIELEKETSIENKRLTEELRRNKMKFEADKDEVTLLKNNPELLLLTPQVAKLAEASQNLKNAKTVVSFGDLDHGSEVIEVFRNFIRKIAGGSPKEKK